MTTQGAAESATGSLDPADGGERGQRAAAGSLSAQLTPEKFRSVSHALILLYCLSAGLSIAASQVLLVALLVYWLAYCWVESKARPRQDFGRVHSVWLERYCAALLAWLALSFVATLVGINVWRSLPELFKTSIYLLLPLCLYDLFGRCGPRSDPRTFNRIVTYLIVLVGSLSLAAIHTVISTAADSPIPPKIPGALTESGQLVLVLPVAVGLLFAFSPFTGRDRGAKRFHLASLAILLFLLCLVAAWPTLLPVGSSEPAALAIQLLFAAAAAGIFGCSLVRAFRAADYRSQGDGILIRPGNLPVFHLLALATALLSCSLLLNLKRGPWSGAVAAMLIVCAARSRRLLVAVIFTCALLLLLLSPARKRLGDSAADFTIFGGRLSMWSLGVELAGRFPLGLGPDNASYMQVLDPTMPAVHKHMHNNYLNVAVETGWLGLAAFVWWSLVSIAAGFSVWRSVRRSADAELRRLGFVSLALAAGLVGWQVSGLVEYNFGDGEIRLVVFFFMGLLLTLAGAVAELTPEGSTKKTPETRRKKR